MNNHQKACQEGNRHCKWGLLLALCRAVCSLLILCSICPSLGCQRTASVVNDCIHRPDGHGSDWSRDSQVVQYSVASFIRDSFEIYESYKDSSLDSIQPIIDTIMRSPDGLKMLAIVVIKCYSDTTSWSYQIADRRVDYDGHIVLGYRDVENMIWRICPFVYYSSSQYTECYGARNSILKYLFNEFASDGQYVMQSDGVERLVEYGYSPKSSLFWDSCLLWRRDIRGDFEYERIARYNLLRLTPSLIDSTIPIVKFPDEIQNLFNPF